MQISTRAPGCGQLLLLIDGRRDPPPRHAGSVRDPPAGTVDLQLASTVSKSITWDHKKCLLMFPFYEGGIFLSVNDGLQSKKKGKSKPISGRLLFTDELDSKIIGFLEKPEVNASEWIRRAVRNEYRRSEMPRKRYRLQSARSVSNSQLQDRAPANLPFLNEEKEKETSFFHQFFE
ncbi:hypothetical protein QO009_004124 [Brevibacillus aydinogluensis]|jgi:hypothetical protein|uniref:hypothetical protein n=1 Tax=Brevibacillus aydinogluensis TaxID=927786 RepID=UPI0028929A7A|nr:hypothetical protein [Brevibacillus aydinogluensis]MDT3418199.1 hypothetical protein [Brevibacillus aydinogluensis]